MHIVICRTPLKKNFQGRMIKLSIDEMDTENIPLDPPQENKNKNKEKVRGQEQE